MILLIGQPLGRIRSWASPKAVLYSPPCALRWRVLLLVEEVEKNEKTVRPAA
jgi:hypothetical protein